MNAVPAVNGLVGDAVGLPPERRVVLAVHMDESGMLVIMTYDSEERRYYVADAEIKDEELRFLPGERGWYDFEGAGQVYSDTVMARLFTHHNRKAPTATYTRPNMTPRRWECPSGGDTTNYDLDDWHSALETASVYEWCAMDARKHGGDLAAWLADLYTDEVVGQDEDRLWCALEALKARWEAAKSRVFAIADKADFVEAVRRVKLPE